MSSLNRNSVIRKHIGMGLIFRVGGILANLMVIPLTLKVLGDEKFGIWVTLLTIINWVSFFDLGIGSGLRNKVTESLSKEDTKGAREYICTAYGVMGVSVGIAAILYAMLSKFVDWSSVFNSRVLTREEFYILLVIVIVGSLINFAISLSVQLYYSIQEASIGSLGNFLSQGFILIALALGARNGGLGVQEVALINMGMLIAVNLLLNYTFFKKNRKLLPNLGDFKREKIASLMSLGGKFFIIQMATVVILTTDNMIITRLLGPSYVTNYNIISKLFSLVIIGHGIILSPLWSAYTEAYTRKDIAWLKRNRRIMYLLMIPIIFGIGFLYLIHPFIIKLWIGRDLGISKSLVALFGLYTIIYSWSNLHIHLLNGLGRVKLQLPIWVFQGIINIPLSIYFVRVMGLGVNGVILGTTMSLVLIAIVAPIELGVTIKELER